MFKRKDEEWDYVGDYYQSDDYRQDDPEKDIKYSGTYQEQLKELFERQLMEGEQILCVSGGGNINARLPLENEGAQKKIKAFGIVKKVFIALFIIVFFMGFFGDKIFKGADAFFAVIIMLFMFLSPIAMIVAVVFIISWYAKKGQKGLSYAITDKRIICYAYGNWQEIPLECIVSTTAKAGADNRGKITVKARNVPNMGTYVVYMIPWIEDPFKVKYMLDEAIENCKANQY